MKGSLLEIKLDLEGHVVMELKQLSSSPGGRNPVCQGGLVSLISASV